ncbi:MAG: hypothetical protein JOS17DRAFT_845274, partial [Linnemannia elongata]
CAKPFLDKKTARGQAAPCPSTSSPTAAVTPSARSTAPAPVARTLRSVLKPCLSLLLSLPLPTTPSESSARWNPRPTPHPVTRMTPTKEIKGTKARRGPPQILAILAILATFFFLCLSSQQICTVLSIASFDVQTGSSRPYVHHASPHHYT